MVESHTNLNLRRRAPAELRAAASRLSCVLSMLLAAGAVVGAGVLFERRGFAARQEVARGEAAQVLAPGETVSRQMKPGDTHAFVLQLAAGQFARVVVAQRGVNVGVRLSAPGGAPVGEMDSPNGLFGLEAVSVVAAAEGSYRVEVYSYPTTTPGDYELRVEGPREATAADERRVTAERVFVEAQVLRLEAGAKPREQALEQYERAIEKYKEALPVWRELADLRGEGYALYGIGHAYKALGKLAPALEHMNQARERLREADDRSGQAFVLNETGAAHRDLGDLNDAAVCYEQAVELRVGLGDLFGQAQLYNNLGLTYSYIGFQPKAVENYEKALPIWRGLGSRQFEMYTLLNAAKAHAEMGDLGVALTQYQEVLTFCDGEAAKPDSPLKSAAAFLKPSALNGLGLVYDTWAEAEAARAYYTQALELFRENQRVLKGAGEKRNSRRGEADVLDNLGTAHAFMGDAQQGLEYFLEAHAIRKELDEPRPSAVTLSNIGYAHALLGNNGEALKQLALALPLSERARDRRFAAYTHFRMGMAHAALGEPVKALESYEKALAIQQEKAFADRRGQALTLDKMGEALALAGRPVEALGRYWRAHELWRGVGDEQGRALTLYGIARVESRQQNLANARDRVEEALNVVERLRRRVSGRQLRMTYFAGKQDMYTLAIDVRMRLHELADSAADRESNIEAALSISERARARNLLDLLSAAGAEPHKGMSPQDADKDRRLEGEIGTLTQALLRMRGLDAKESAALVQQKLDARIREQDELRAATRKSGLSSAEEEAARPLSAREIQRRLDDDTLLLQFSLAEGRSHLWAVTPTDIRHHFLEGRAELEGAAEQLRQALTAYEPRRADESDDAYLKRWRGAPGSYRRSALELSRMVLGRVSSRLGNKRLVIVADGALQYIPFEVLPLPEAAGSDRAASDAAPLPVLLSQNEVVYQPSASALALLRRARPRSVPLKTVAVLADPVFDNTDDRVRLPPGARGGAVAQARAPGGRLSRSLRDMGAVGDANFTLSKLEYSLREANAITAVAPRGSWMKAVGFKANRATVTSPALRQFSIVHFATHGILNDRHPELSGIVLSMVNQRGEPEDGYLTLRDIYNLDLPVDLVVLSACQTGIGRQVRGEGLLGLTRGFMYAGSPRVVASLWRVDDAATAELMRLFYNHMLGKNRLPASAALRRAKLEMMGAGGQRRPPYYWAGFVLQGDWK